MRKVHSVFAVLFSLVLAVAAFAGCSKPEENIIKQKAKVEDGAYYTLFVNAFADSDGNGAGDLQGVIDNLDYLNDGKGGGLGVKGIWLMPIFASSSDHKYDITDFYSISRSYGDFDTFDKLVKECHSRGMTLILDLVLNCTSSDHPWFQSALKDKNSPYREYYQFYSDLKDKENYDREEKWWVNESYPIWQELTSGDAFVGVYHKSMPDLNFKSEKVRNEAKNIAKFWLDKGVDGFRLDSAMHIFTNGELPKVNGETPDFHAANVDWWQEFYDYCQTVKEGSYLVGEVWTDETVRGKYLKPLKSDFNFSTGGFIVDAVNETEKGKSFSERVNSVYLEYDKTTTDYKDSPFLTNHDMPRTATILNGDENKMKLAASMYLTLEGNPYLYYGEELGQSGDGNSNRKAFKWGEGSKYNATRFADKTTVSSLKEQIKNEDSLYNHYKKLLKVRNDYKAFNGEFTPIKADGLIVYKMAKDGQEALIIHNTGKDAAAVNLDLTGYEKVFDSFGNFDNKNLAPQSSLIFVK